MAGETRYFVLTRWDSEESFQAWASAREGHAAGTTVSSAEGMLEFEVVDLGD